MGSWLNIYDGMSLVLLISKTCAEVVNILKLICKD